MWRTERLILKYNVENRNRYNFFFLSFISIGSRVEKNE